MTNHPARRRPAASTRPGGVPPANRFACTSYAAGHAVHWIQALHTANKPEVFARSWSGRLLAVTGERLTVEREDGGVVVFRNHNHERLLAIASRLPAAVLVNDQYSILRLGSYAFSVQPDTGKALGPCPTGRHDEDAAALGGVQRTGTHHAD